MKIGVSSYSFNHYLSETKCGYEKILEIAKEIGFSGVEFINLRNETWGEGDGEESIARRIREKADALGLAIPAYTVHANFLCDDPEAEVARICHDLDISALLGAGVLRHDASFSLKNTPGYTWESGIREMAPYIRRVAEYGASLGIRTCTENHGYIYQDAIRVKTLIEAVDHPNFGWLVDMGNFVVTDGDPLSSVKLALPYAAHMHAKDFVVKRLPEGAPMPEGFARSRAGALWRGTVLGHGVVPVDACIALAKEAGYSGWVSLEFEGIERNLDALRMGYTYLARCVGE